MSAPFERRKRLPRTYDGAIGWTWNTAERRFDEKTLEGWPGRPWRPVLRNGASARMMRVGGRWIMIVSAAVEEDLVEEPEKPALPPRPVVWEALPTDPFVCPAFGKTSHAFCHEAFLDAHAPDRPESPCFRCRIGVKVRMATASGEKRAPEYVVDGGVSYHTENRQGRGFLNRIDAFLRWSGTTPACEDRP